MESLPLILILLICNVLKMALLLSNSLFKGKFNIYLKVVFKVTVNLCKKATKNRQTKISMTNGSLMKVEGIAECSPWSILQYFDLH